MMLYFSQTRFGVRFFFGWLLPRPAKESQEFAMENLQKCKNACDKLVNRQAKQLWQHNIAAAAASLKVVAPTIVAIIKAN